MEDTAWYALTIGGPLALIANALWRLGDILKSLSIHITIVAPTEPEPDADEPWRG